MNGDFDSEAQIFLGCRQLAEGTTSSLEAARASFDCFHIIIDS